MDIRGMSGEKKKIIPLARKLCSRTAKDLHNFKLQLGIKYVKTRGGKSLLRF